MRAAADAHEASPSSVWIGYALFHTLARSCADLMVGGENADRSKHAWQQVYRSLEHGNAKTQCKKRDVISKFPKVIEDFANHFVTMQIKRHKADYDPYSKYAKSEVIQDIDVSEQTIRDFLGAPVKDRRAFSAWVLFKARSE